MGEVMRFFASQVFLFTLAGMLASEGLLQAQTVNNGFEQGASLYAGVRYRSFGNSGGGADIRLGTPPNCDPAPATGLCDSPVGATQAISWSATTNTFSFSYDGANLTTQVNSNPQISNVPTLTGINYIQIDVIAKNGTTVALSNVKLGAAPLGSGSFSATSTTRLWNVTGVSLDSSFAISGNIVVTPAEQTAGDASYIQISVGHYTPPDADAPEVSNIVIDPDPVYINGSATLTADIDDTGTGGSNIVSAEYNLNDSGWLSMAAADGTFGSASESVTATLSSLTTLGVNTVCVRGTDSAGNTSDGTDCNDFTVTYRFFGFFQPIDNTVPNDAKAGQTVPAKWRLTDANGTPIDDPSSFAGIWSYPVSCTDLSASVGDAIEEYSPGNSGLQYNGDGYWQYNWQTQKGYANTCRAFYVGFGPSDTTPPVTTSPVANFKFKK
jgi:hypothetical protein